MKTKWIRSAKQAMVLLLAVVLVLAGCAQSNNDNNNGGGENQSAVGNPSEGTNNGGSDNAKPYDGVEINVGVEAGGPAPEFFKTIINEFTEQTGIKVNIIDVPGLKMHDTFVTESIAGTGGFDVFNLDQPWIPEFAEKGFLVPLNDYVDEADLDDFYPVAIDSVTYKGSIYGLPYLVHTPVVYYRTDLFEKAGITEPAKTVEQYREYAKKLTDPTNGIYGTIIEGQQSPEPATQFTDWVLQHGGKLLDENNKVKVDSPEVLQTFKTLLAMQYEDKSSPPGAVNYNNADVQQQFMQGKVAMVRNWPYMYAMAQDPAQSKVAGKFAIALQPVTSAVWSWGFGISKDSKNKDAAFEFVKWASSSDVVTRFVKQVTNPVPRKSSMEAIKADPNIPEETKNAILMMTENMIQGTSVALNPAYDSFRNRVAVMLSKIMTKQSTPEEEIKAAAADLQKIADGE